MPRFLEGIDYTWNGGTTGDWDNNTNWLPPGYPKTPDDSANFSISSDTTITASSDPTINIIVGKIDLTTDHSILTFLLGKSLYLGNSSSTPTTTPSINFSGANPQLTIEGNTPLNSSPPSPYASASELHFSTSAHGGVLNIHSNSNTMLVPLRVYKSLAVVLFGNGALGGPVDLEDTSDLSTGYTRNAQIGGLEGSSQKTTVALGHNGPLTVDMSPFSQTFTYNGNIPHIYFTTQNLTVIGPQNTDPKNHINFFVLGGKNYSGIDTLYLGTDSSPGYLKTQGVNIKVVEANSDSVWNNLGTSQIESLITAPGTVIELGGPLTISSLEPSASTIEGTIRGTGLNIAGQSKTTISGDATGINMTTLTEFATLTGSTESLPRMIQSNGYVYFEQTANGTYSGKIDGSGTIAIDSPATLTFTGSITGDDITVGEIGSGATAIFNCQVIAKDGEIFVNPYATLGGTGTFGSASYPATMTVISDATLAPPLVDPMTVIGDVFIQFYSTYLVDIQGKNASRLDVDGTVQISSAGIPTTLKINSIQDPVLGNVYTLITATELQGQFTNVIFPSSVYKYQLHYSDDPALQLILTGVSLESFVWWDNPGLVAFYLDEGDLPASEDFEEVIGDLADLSSDPATLADALNQLHPAAFSDSRLPRIFAVQQPLAFTYKAAPMSFSTPPARPRAPRCYCRGLWVDFLGDSTIKIRQGYQDTGYRDRGYYASCGADCFATYGSTWVLLPATAKNDLRLDSPRLEWQYR